MTDTTQQVTVRRPPVTRWRPLLLSAVAVLLLAEVAVRLISLGLEPAGDWSRSDITQHQTGLRPQADDLDLLVVGSSMVGRAVSPVQLSAAGGPARGYNFWLAGPAMRSVSALTTDVLLKETDPKVVLIGVSMREFNGAPSQNNQFISFTQSYVFQSEAGQAGTVDRLDHALQSASYLARYRLTLRDPAKLVNDLRTPRLPIERLGSDGFLIERGQSELANEPRAHFNQERAAMAGYNVDQADIDALATLLDELASRRIPALVVNLPVTQTFISMANDGTADYDNYVRKVESTTRSHGGQWLDAMQTSWADTNFGDVDHLNDTGTAALQPMILDALHTITGSPEERPTGDPPNPEPDSNP